MPDTAHDQQNFALKCKKVDVPVSSTVCRKYLNCQLRSPRAFMKTTDMRPGMTCDMHPMWWPVSSLGEGRVEAKHLVDHHVKVHQRRCSILDGRVLGGGGRERGRKRGRERGRGRVCNAC